MKIGLNTILTVLLLFYFSQYEISAQETSKRIKQLSKDSEVIFTGKVIKKQSNWNKEKSKIFTDVFVKVREYIKGKKTESTVIVRHLGGEVGGVGEIYTHMPRFKESEEVLLFVKKGKDNKYRVTDGENGKITITQKEESPQKRAVAEKRVRQLRREISNYVKEEMIKKIK